ncbi:MAG: hypothetical protein HY716_09520 [Planctomycetes bacterium]|nr:hypothetical protein [Planctomycetota bacterium]
MLKAKTASILLGLLLVSAAEAQDKIVWKDNTPTYECRVLSLTYEKITYDLGAGAPQQSNARNVREIEFDPNNVPFDFPYARQELQRNPSKDVATRFERMKKDPRTSEPARDFCRKHIIEALLGAGDFEGAIAAAKALRTEKSDSFFLRDSFVLQYEAAQGLNDAKLQEETLKEFEAAAREKRMSEWNKDVDLMKADAAEAKQNHHLALEIYNKYANDREVRDAASLGILRCLSAMKDWVRLKSKAEAVLSEVKQRKDAPVRLHLAATTARGDALMAEGKVKEALLDFIYGAWELGPRLGELSREHEAALAKASIAAAQYAKSFGEKNKENKTRYLQRAHDLFQELQRTYPRTAWKPEVAEALKRAEKSQ